MQVVLLEWKSRMKSLISISSPLSSWAGRGERGKFKISSKLWKKRGPVNILVWGSITPSCCQRQHHKRFQRGLPSSPLMIQELWDSGNSLASSPELQSLTQAPSTITGHDHACAGACYPHQGSFFGHPWPWWAKQAGQWRGLDLGFFMLGKAGISALPHFTSL